MELSKVKEGVKITFVSGEKVYKGIIIGKYGRGELTKDSSILIESNEFQYGHSGQNCSFKLDNSRLEDITGRNRYFVNIQNLHLDIEPKSTQPEQQFITGMALKLKNNPKFLVAYGGTMVTINKYKDYNSSTTGYMVETNVGNTYECDFEAFEGPTIEESIKINPTNYKDIGIDPSIKEYKTYPTIPKEPILSPIANSTPSIAEPEIKVKLDTTLFIGKKLPTLNTNF